MRAPSLALLGGGLLVAGALTSCLGDPNAPRDVALELDEPFFRCQVQPVLTRNCSMFACHGDGRRFFVIYARNRLRLGVPMRDAFLTASEREHNFAAASAMVVPGHPELSPLVMKPLDPSAGGWYHVGGDTPFHGGDPFTTTEDPGYQVLVDWVNGATDPEGPSCTEPGSAS